jgi:hypothetical protein
VTVVALVFSIVISTGSFVWAFAGVGFFVFARSILIFGAVWLFTQWRGWKWFSSLALFFAIFISVIGLWFGFSMEWFYSGVIFALFAWDMSDFRNRIRTIFVDDNLRRMERRHLARISLLSLTGLSLVSIVMLVSRQFTFEWGVLLAVVALLGLSQLIVWVKN